MALVLRTGVRIFHRVGLVGGFGCGAGDHLCRQRFTLQFQFRRDGPDRTAAKPEAIREAVQVPEAFA